MKLFLKWQKGDDVSHFILFILDKDKAYTLCLFDNFT